MGVFCDFCIFVFGIDIDDGLIGGEEIGNDCVDIFVGVCWCYGQEMGRIIIVYQFFCFWILFDQKFSIGVNEVCCFFCCGKVCRFMCVVCYIIKMFDQCGCDKVDDNLDENQYGDCVDCDIRD